VRIVPSTGRTTALRASAAASTSAPATSVAPTLAAVENRSHSPRRSWDKMTPEFPLAPMRDPWVTAWHTSAIEAAGSRDSSSVTTESTVSIMLVPVSPSGTG
jgi:hypothetical protein